MRDSRNTKTILLILPVIALLLAMPAATVVADNSHSKNFAELVWGNGTLWSMVAPPSPVPHPGASQGQEDFYEEAPQCPTAAGPGCPFYGTPFSPQSTDCTHLGIDPVLSHSTCYHDHTLGSVPGQPGFRALWHVYIVLCGTSDSQLAPPTFGLSSAAANGWSCAAGPVTGTIDGLGPVTLNLAGTVKEGSTVIPLTSAAAIDNAAAAGVVIFLDTQVTFICPVQPYWG